MEYRAPRRYYVDDYREQRAAAAAQPAPAGDRREPIRDTFNVDSYARETDAEAARRAQTDADWNPGARTYVAQTAEDIGGGEYTNHFTSESRQPATHVEPAPQPAAPQQQRRVDYSAFVNAPPPTIQWVTSTGVPLGPPQPVQRHQYYYDPTYQDDLLRSQTNTQEGYDDHTILRSTDTHGGADQTAISHDGSHVHTAPQNSNNLTVLPPAAIGSPVLVEPRPGSDYAKMSAPTPSVSFMSFNTHLRRLRNFFKAVNNLPWVTEDRVTVDYIPKGARKQVSGVTRKSLYTKHDHVHLSSDTTPSSDFSSNFRRRMVLPRPLTSWYGRGSARQSVDLLSGGSSSPSQTIEPFPTLGYAPSATPGQQDVALPAHITPFPLTPSNRTPPAPPPAEVPAEVPPPAEEGPHTDTDVDMEEARLASNTIPGAWPPTYPHGYAAYQSPRTNHTPKEAIHYIPQTQNAPIAFVVSAQH
ncbi:hypothetical protein ONZ45_g5145 [Pleurotus djamor]|nr:hypothetical protein ONZ45_g5145 [Pleurotus djamor]